MQKLNYIYNNPLQPKWQLCKIPEEYFYSAKLNLPFPQDLKMKIFPTDTKR